MKTLYILCLLSISLFASSFEDASALYQKKEYEQAIVVYEQLLQSGTVNSSVYYNLGNCYYRTGKIGPAIYNYLKAEQLNPGDEDIKTNIKIASRRITDKIETLPEGFFAKALRTATGIFSISGWGYMALLFFILTLSSGVIFLFTRSLALRRASFFMLPLFVIITAHSLFSGFYLQRTASGNRKAVVLVSSVSLRSSPEQGATENMVIHEGLIVKAEDFLEDWIKVRLADGKTGWVQKSGMGLI